MTQQSKSKTESKVENKLTIPYPPKEVFANRDVAETMLSEGNVTHLLDHFEYPASGGILIHIVDAKFPKKGERKAQSGDIACLRQLTSRVVS